MSETKQVPVEPSIKMTTGGLCSISKLRFASVFLGQPAEEVVNDLLDHIESLSAAPQPDDSELGPVLITEEPDPLPQPDDVYLGTPVCPHCKHSLEGGILFQKHSGTDHQFMRIKDHE